MIKAQISKDDSILEKYNIDANTSFVKTLLADLGETYKRSTISRPKVLFGSIFPVGLGWNYNSTLNHRISPIYQAIRSIDNSAIPLGDPPRLESNTFQIYFNRVYQTFQQYQIQEF